MELIKSRLFHLLSRFKSISSFYAKLKELEGIAMTFSHLKIKCPTTFGVCSTSAQNLNESLTINTHFTPLNVCEKGGFVFVLAGIKFEVRAEREKNCDIFYSLLED